MDQAYRASSNAAAEAVPVDADREYRRTASQEFMVTADAGK